MSDYIEHKCPHCDALTQERDQANTIASDAKWQNERLVAEVQQPFALKRVVEYRKKYWGPFYAERDPVLSGLLELIDHLPAPPSSAPAQETKSEN